MSDSDELRMYLVIRTDLPEMTPGKLAVQSGHAFSMLTLKVLADEADLLTAYIQTNIVKIAVGVHGLPALQKTYEEARKEGYHAVMIPDAGRTCFPEPTYTVCAFGPVRRSALTNGYLKRLRLY